MTHFSPRLLSLRAGELAFSCGVGAIGEVTSDLDAFMAVAERCPACGQRAPVQAAIDRKHGLGLPKPARYGLVRLLAVENEHETYGVW